MTKKFSSFKGHQLITESWRTFVDGSETSAQGSEMELEEGLFSQSMAVQGEIDKHVLNLFRVLEALRPVDRKEIIDPIINELQAIANEDSLPQIGDDPRDQSPLEEMYEGYGPGGVRGSSYSGFPPAQARALAKQLAAMSSRKSLSYGDEGKLNDYLGQQKYSTSREAKDDIIKYLVGNGFGYRADYT